MPYRLTPQDIVTMLEESLPKVGTKADLAEPVEDIQKKLKLIKGYYPSLKNLEIRIIEMFKQIGSKICRDDVLKKHDDVAEVKRWFQSIDEILTKIVKLSEENRILPVGNKVFMEQDSFSRRQAMESSSSYKSQFYVDTRLIVTQASSSLKITFDNLDHQSRLCSLCLSVFPDNAEIKKRPLIYWWMGEGFVRDTVEKVAEEVGDDIFNKLCRKGLVQAVYKDRNPIVGSCRIHPWVRKMLLGVLTEANFSDFVNKVYIRDMLLLDLTDANFSDFVNKVYNRDGTHERIRQRVGLVEAEVGSQVQERKMEMRKMEMLGAVFNVNKKYLQIESEVLLSLKRVKVLQLGRWQRLPEDHIELEVIGDTKKPRDDSQEALISLGAMKQLRYLSLQGISGVNDLPESIGEILNLEILDLRACHNLGKLPSTIGSLLNLTHLDVTECYFLESMPKGIEKLNSLQVLKGFMIGAHPTSSCKLKDLSRLTKLRKLSIYIRNKAYNLKEHGDFRGIGSLRSLTITWGGGKGTQEETEPKSVKFPTSLQKLDLRCYPFRNAPDWLSPGNLKELKKLYIRGGLLERIYNPESDENYESLQILRLKYLYHMKKVTFRTDKVVPTISIDGKDREFRSLEYYEMAWPEGAEGEEFENGEWTKVHGYRSIPRKKDELV